MQGVLAHEIGHTLGLIHEHQRPDRDQYINIHTSSILDSAQDHFMPISGKYVETRDMPYDYGSDMHYRMDVSSSKNTFVNFSLAWLSIVFQAFSKDGYNTIETKDRRFQRSLGQRVGLSFWDYRAINEVYCMGEFDARIRRFSNYCL